MQSDKGSMYCFVRYLLQVLHPEFQVSERIQFQRLKVDLTQYSTIILMFSTIIMASISFEKIFQAVGNMVITMIALMTGCIVNIVLDPLLIFGIGFFPKLGIPIAYKRLTNSF